MLYVRATTSFASRAAGPYNGVIVLMRNEHREGATANMYSLSICHYHA